MFKKLTIFIFIVSIFFIAIPAKAQGEETPDGVQYNYYVGRLITLLESSDVKITSLESDINIVKKPATELKSLILRKTTQADVSETYVLNFAEELEKFKLGMKKFDDEKRQYLYPFDEFEVLVDGQKLALNEESIDGSDYYTWEIDGRSDEVEFDANLDDLKKSIEFEVNYTIEATNERENYFEKFIYELTNSSWSEDADSININFNFPFDITQRTFSGLPVNIADNISVQDYSIDEDFDSLEIEYKNESLADTSDLSVKFLPERINTNLLESIFLLSRDNSSFEGKLARANALTEMMLMFDEANFDPESSSLSSEAASLFSELYLINPLEKNLQIDYSYALVNLLGDSNDDAFINELFTIFFNFNPTDPRGLEVRYIILTNQKYLNFNQNFQPVDPDNFLFLSQKTNVKGQLETANWITSADYEAERIDLQNKTRPFVPNSETIISSLNTLYEETKNPRFLELLITSKFFGDFADSRYGFNIEKINNAAVLNLKNYEEQFFLNIENLIDTYQSSRSEGDNMLPQILLNYYDPDQFAPLSEENSSYVDSESLNLRSTTDKLKSTGQYFQEWFTDDITDLVIIGIVFIAIFILAIRTSFKPGTLWKLLPKRKPKPKTGKGTDAIKEAGIPTFPETESKGSSNPLNRPRGLMD